MTLFSRRLYFVCFCLSLLSYYYTPVYCYITYKTTISEKILATPFVFSSYFHTHPLGLTLLLQILGGRMHGPSPCTSNFGGRPPVSPKSPPMPKTPSFETRTHDPQSSTQIDATAVHQRSYSMHFSDRYAWER